LRQPPLELLNLFAAARGTNFHRAVGAVLDVTVETEPLGLVPYKIAKTNPLHAAVDNESSCERFGERLHCRGEILHTLAASA